MRCWNVINCQNAYHRKQEGGGGEYNVFTMKKLLGYRISAEGFSCRINCNCTDFIAD